jgi:membrane protein implicated in regulation of membrane protease activity
MALVVGILLALFVLDGAWEWVAVAVGGAIEIAEAYGWWHWTNRRRPTVGVEALIGAETVVNEDGWVRVQGELWRQRGGAPGQRVRVRAVDGLTLEVDPEGPS